MELRIQHDFAEHLARFHILVGRPSILQRERTVHDWFQATGKDVAQHLVQFTHRAHIRAQEIELAGEQKT